MIHEMTEKERVHTGLEIEELCSELISDAESCVVCNDRFVEYILIVPEQQSEDILYSRSKSLQNRILEKYGIDTIIGLSETVRDLIHLHPLISAHVKPSTMDISSKIIFRSILINMGLLNLKCLSKAQNSISKRHYFRRHRYCRRNIRKYPDINL